MKASLQGDFQPERALLTSWSRTGRQIHLLCPSPAPCKSRLWHQRDTRALSQLRTWHNMLKGILAPDSFICGHAPHSAHLNSAAPETTAWLALHDATVSPCTRGGRAKPPSPQCTPGSPRKQAVQATISLELPLHGPCLLAWFLPVSVVQQTWSSGFLTLVTRAA